MLSIANDGQAEKIQYSDNGLILRHRVFPKVFTIRHPPLVQPVRPTTRINYLCKEHTPPQTKRIRGIETLSAGEANMKITRMRIFQTLLGVCLMLGYLAPHAAATMLKEGGQTYLVDRTGERWDITQAVSIGFEPNHFEFGIGRHAFNPLDDTHWQSGLRQNGSGMRVVGVAGNADAHAYSVNKLRYHETANTFLGSEAIVAGY